MTSAKKLKAEYQVACDAFQQAIDESVIRLDAPDEYGFWWKVTMPLEEYDDQRAELRAMRARIKRTEEAEEMELALDQFLHEAE